MTSGDPANSDSEYALQRLVALSNYDISTPVIAIVDTSFLRTGLHAHLSSGQAPRSLVAMQSESVRAFMEGETLREMFRKIPEFAKQLDVSELKLKELFVDEWMPSIKVVELPTYLRELDERSLTVHQRDKDDFAAASLAALLSPCILLTHDLDFKAPGVNHREQGLFAICLIEDVNDGDAEVRAVAMIPAAPLFALGVGTKHAYDRFGPIALGVAGLLAAGGVLLYFKQPVERRESIKNGMGKVLRALVEMYGEAAAVAEHARRELRKNLVPPSTNPPPVAAILRALATTQTSLSAQQLHDELESTYSFDVCELRAYLHGNKETIVFEERRGGFQLGIPYHLWLGRLRQHGNVSE